MAKRNYPGSIRDRGTYFQVRLCVTRARNRSEYHNFRVEGTDRAGAEAFARTKYNDLLADAAYNASTFGTKPSPEPFSSLLARFKTTELPTVRQAPRRPTPGRWTPWRASSSPCMETHRWP